MGMFDSYRVSWADESLEIQTKQTDCIMDTWLLGDAAPYPCDPDASFRGDSRCWSLLEDSSIGNGWSDPSSERHFSLLHFSGAFCDFSGGLSEAEALAAGERLRALWDDPSWRSEGLSRLLALSRRRESYRSGLLFEWTSLARDWLSVQEEASSSPKPGRRLFALLRHDFEQEPLEAAFRRRLDHPTELPGFLRPEAGDPAESEEPSDERRSMFRSREPDAPPFPIPPSLSPPEAAAFALRSARLDALLPIALASPSILEDAALSRSIAHALREASFSRIFAPDAAAFMAQTGFFPDHLGPEGFESAPLDWLAGRMGLPSALLRPLLARSPRSSSTPFLLLHGYETLLGAALGPATPDDPIDAEGMTLLQRATLVSNLRAIQALLSLGANPDASGSGGSRRPLLLALERAQRSWFPPPFERDAMSLQGRCVQALLSGGASQSALPGEPEPRSLFTPELAKFYADGERSLLSEGLPPAADPPKRPRGV